jgi:hypothetical protein
MASKDITLTPVPVPSASQFKALIPPTATASTTVTAHSSSQSSLSTGRTSQPDPIVQFSSPISRQARRDEQNAARPRQAGVVTLEKRRPDSGTPNVITRVVGGEMVLGVESDSEDDAQEEEQCGIQQSQPIEASGESGNVVVAVPPAAEEASVPVEVDPPLPLFASYRQSADSRHHRVHHLART